MRTTGFESVQISNFHNFSSKIFFKVRGFSCARYKKFDFYEQAMEFVLDHSDNEEDIFQPPPVRRSNNYQSGQSRNRTMPTDMVFY